MAKLQDKLNLCCLMELVFKTPSSERTITFDTVAAATGLAVGEVEMMLMHALSLELIRGDIDGVASTISVTWVLPRVLDTPQMGALKTKLVDWSQRVQTTLITLEDHAAEVMLDC
jgi:26S proteasome regulatory subunit N9|tara:strand:- start:32 stop:376 length:345 start_codon:yes stop_codon:yes gene_type:complete